MTTERVWHPPTPHTVDAQGADIHPAFGAIEVMRHLPITTPTTETP